MALYPSWPRPRTVGHVGCPHSARVRVPHAADRPWANLWTIRILPRGGCGPTRGPPTYRHDYPVVIGIDVLPPDLDVSPSSGATTATPPAPASTSAACAPTAMRLSPSRHHRLSTHPGPVACHGINQTQPGPARKRRDQRKTGTVGGLADHDPTQEPTDRGRNRPESRGNSHRPTRSSQLASQRARESPAESSKPQPRRTTSMTIEICLIHTQATKH